MLSAALTLDQLGYAASKLEAAQVALKAGHLTMARLHIAKFWSDKGVGDDYDDFDAADDVASLDNALAAVLSGSDPTGAIAHIEAMVGGNLDYALWADHLDEAIDDLNSRG